MSIGPYRLLPLPQELNMASYILDYNIKQGEVTRMGHAW
jgi:hypothetical protein